MKKTYKAENDCLLLFIIIDKQNRYTECFLKNLILLSDSHIASHSPTSFVFLSNRKLSANQISRNETTHENQTWNTLLRGKTCVWLSNFFDFKITDIFLCLRLRDVQKCCSWHFWRSWQCGCLYFFETKRFNIFCSVLFICQICKQKFL